MNTTKRISLLSATTVKKAEQGNVYSYNNDLFILAKLKNDEYSDPIQNALFISAPHQIRIRSKTSSAKYNLISIKHGEKFYDRDRTLDEIIERLSRNDFRLVENIEFKEYK